MKAPMSIDPRAARHVIADYSPLAQLLREQVDRHFGTPDRHGPQHQVWNYWYVPDSYTYLRTSPEKVVERPLVEQFHAGLMSFAIEQLGMDHVSWPFLSLYVDGCGQALHNDSRNGEFGYVYSLTRWDERHFSGGETLLFHAQDYWGSGRFAQSGATSAFYELVPSRFNQLLLFDDRVPHSVPTVRGVSDPRAARLVLHGHLSARRVIVRGPLSEPPPGGAEWEDRLVALMEATLKQQAGQVHGVSTIELKVEASGRVASCRPLVDRVLPLAPGADPAALLARISQDLSALPFPAAEGDSVVTVPFVFGG